MLHIALILLCFAQIVHYARYWAVLSIDMYADYSDRRLKSHLDWSRTSNSMITGDTRPGSAMRRSA